MAEISLNTYLKKGLQPYGRTLRVENLVGPGTPDVYARIVRPRGLDLWVENKVLPAFPKRPSTVVRCDHYRVGQRNWHRVWRRHGAAVVVFLRVGRVYYLFDADVACRVLGTVTREGLEGVSLGRWAGRVDWSEWVRLVVEYPWGDTVASYGGDRLLVD